MHTSGLYAPEGLPPKFWPSRQDCPRQPRRRIPRQPIEVQLLRHLHLPQQQEHRHRLRPGQNPIPSPSPALGRGEAPAVQPRIIGDQQAGPVSTIDEPQAHAGALFPAPGGDALAAEAGEACCGQRDRQPESVLAADQHASVERVLDVGRLGPDEAGGAKAGAGSREVCLPDRVCEARLKTRSRNLPAPVVTQAPPGGKDAAGDSTLGLLKDLGGERRQVAVDGGADLHTSRASAFQT